MPVHPIIDEALDGFRPKEEKPKQWTKAYAGTTRIRCVVQRRGGRPTTICESVIDAEAHSLIAAAPTMLQALKSARQSLRADGGAQGTLEEIEAAIALAEGR